MKLLREALKDFKRVQDKPEVDDELDLNVDDEHDSDDLLGNGNEEFRTGDEGEVEGGNDEEFDIGTSDEERQPGDEEQDAPWSNLVGGANSGGPVDGTEPRGQDDTDGNPDTPEDSDELSSIATKATENPDRQGVIRTVRGAHLIYKRQVQDGGYEELWIYNVDNMRDEMTIRKAILAGTDIPINQSSSPDGSQTYTLWSAGNAEMLLITGLPN